MTVSHCTYQTTDINRIADLLKLPAFDNRPTYRVRVYHAGTHEATYHITALDAAEAVAAVEEEMDIQPPSVTRDRDGKLSIRGWHGYEFRVREVALA